jgi:uncharacterized membrane protein YciS (DUF1049 family)
VKIILRILAALAVVLVAGEAVSVASGHLMNKETQFVCLLTAGVWALSAFIASLWRK